MLYSSQILGQLIQAGELEDRIRRLEEFGGVRTALRFPESPATTRPGQGSRPAAEREKAPAGALVGATGVPVTMGELPDCAVKRRACGHLLAKLRERDAGRGHPTKDGQLADAGSF